MESVNMVQLPEAVYKGMVDLGYVIVDSTECVIDTHHRIEDVSLFDGLELPLKELTLSEIRETANDGSQSLLGYRLKIGTHESNVYGQFNSICSLAHHIFTGEMNSSTRFNDLTVWKKRESDKIGLLYYTVKPLKTLSKQHKPEPWPKGLSKWQAVGGVSLVVPALTLAYYVHTRAPPVTKQRKSQGRPRPKRKSRRRTL